MKRIVFATILLLLITACNNTKVDSRLTHIEQLMRAHPDAQILIQGGKVVLNGGTIRNGDIRNNGNLTILNNGIVEMCGNDQYRHKYSDSDLDVINNGNTPFPATTNIQRGAFKRVNR